MTRSMLLLLVVTMTICGCGSKTVVIKDCKPVPVDDCNPPDCYGGGVECSWDIVSNSTVAVLASDPAVIAADDRLVGAVILAQGETARTPILEFKGNSLPSDSLLTSAEKTLLRSVLTTKGLFDPSSQSIYFFRTTNQLSLEEGSGSIGIQVEKFTGSLTGVGTIESDLLDGAPLDQLQVFTEHVAMPVCDAGGPYATECKGAQTSVRLDGTGSTSPGGGSLTYLWVSDCPGASFSDATSATPTLTIDASCGCLHSCGAMLFVSNDTLSTACSTTIQISDSASPELSVQLNRDVLWPANHTMANIIAQVTVTDACDPSATWELTSVTSDEPDSAGPGDPPNDIQGADIGTPDVALQLRSERSALGAGRTYTLLYTASDGSGNTVQDTLYVRVPHDQGARALASNGFSTNGKELLPGVATFDVIIPAAQGSVDGSAVTLDVSTIDPQHAYVGNTLDAVRPAGFTRRDLDGDLRADLVLEYPADPVRGLIQASAQLETVGLHFVDDRGGDRLVEDIFGLGKPRTFTPTDSPTNPDPAAIPPRTTLRWIRPNPFNPETSVAYDLASYQHVRIAVYDLRGVLVRTLMDGSQPAGGHEVLWDGRDQAGGSAASGVYFLRLEAGHVRETTKAILMR
jgi:flagellar hook capping protein FlgD